MRASQASSMEHAARQHTHSGPRHTRVQFSAGAARCDKREKCGHGRIAKRQLEPVWEAEQPHTCRVWWRVVVHQRKPMASFGPAHTVCEWRSGNGKTRPQRDNAPKRHVTRRCAIGGLNGHPSHVINWLQVRPKPDDGEIVDQPVILAGSGARVHCSRCDSTQSHSAAESPFHELRYPVQGRHGHVVQRIQLGAALAMAGPAVQWSTIHVRHASCGSCQRPTRTRLPTALQACRLRSPPADECIYQRQRLRTHV